MPGIVHPSDPARQLPEQNIRPEDTLTTPRLHNLISERRADDAAVDDVLVWLGRIRGRLVVSDRRVGVPVRLADETDERLRQWFR